MTLMFGSLLLIHENMLKEAITGVILCAATMTAFLYSWLTAPLEPHHA
jgi:hypothetical protein